MTLLSGAAAAIHHVHSQVEAPPMGTAPPAATITLSGTEQGFYRAHVRNPDTGKHYNLFATGQVSPVGFTFTTGSFQTPGFILGASVNGTIVLHGLRGSVTLSVKETLPTTTSGAPTTTFDFNYTITRATGAFRGDQGTGTVDVTTSPASTATGSLGNEVGRVTLDFNPKATTTT